MNKENILKVADAIEQHSIADLGFNMNSFYSEHEQDLSGHNCGTTACIGGWVVAVLNPYNFNVDNDDLDDQAQDLLGLDNTTASRLFYAITDTGQENHWDATSDQAVKVLRILAETGKVDWDATIA